MDFGAHVKTKMRLHFHQVLLYCNYRRLSVSKDVIFSSKTMFVLISLMVSCYFRGDYPIGIGSIPGRVIPKTQKIVFDASLLNTQHYKVQFEGKCSK